MASITAGLFETRAEAEAAMNDLVSSGFIHSDIDLKAAGAGAGDDSIIRELKGEGVPTADARLYAEGVQAGDALEPAHVSDDRATMAQDIMDRHGTLDIHDTFTQRGGPCCFVSPALPGRELRWPASPLTAPLSPPIALGTLLPLAP